MSQKPTIVFVPGAWFKATAYADFLKALQDAGFPVSASDYPSLDPPAEEAVKTDCKADTDHLREKVLVPLVNHEEKDVVVVMHSYGGMPGSGAAHGLSKSSREKAGKKGGVVGLIMISGFIVAQDVSCAGSMQGDTPPWVLKDKVGGILLNDALGGMESNWLHLAEARALYTRHSNAHFDGRRSPRCCEEES